MLLSRLTSIVLLAFITIFFAPTPSTPSTRSTMEQYAERMAPHDTQPANCRVTLPSDGVFEPRSSAFVGPSFVGPSRTPDQFLFGTEKLWTVLPADGIWRGAIPAQPGDFVYDDKLPWFRANAAFSAKDGPLTVTGKRLDGPAPSFIEIFRGIIASPGKDGNAMLMGGVSIPVFGCWEITGHYNDQDVAFTIWVTSRPGQEPSSRASAPLISSVPPEPASVARRVHLDSETQENSLVYKVLPEIPATQPATASGTVVLHAVIGTDGRARELSYISGPKSLAQAAMDAVVWWRYRIATANLEPYEAREEAEEVDTTIAVSFNRP